jgi:hypothetical protein
MAVVDDMTNATVVEVNFHQIIDLNLAGSSIDSDSGRNEHHSFDFIGRSITSDVTRSHPHGPYRIGNTIAI